MLPRFLYMLITRLPEGCHKVTKRPPEGCKVCSILGKRCSHTHSDIGREVRELGVYADNRSRGGKNCIDHQVGIGKLPMACSVLECIMRFFMVDVSCCGWSPRRNMHVRWRGLGKHACAENFFEYGKLSPCLEWYVGVSNAVLFVLSRLLRYSVRHEPDALIEHVTRVYMKAR